MLILYGYKMKLKTVIAIVLTLFLTACEKDMSFEEYNTKVDICKNKMQGKPSVRYYSNKFNKDIPLDVYCTVDGVSFEITK